MLYLQQEHKNAHDNKNRHRFKLNATCILYHRGEIMQTLLFCFWQTVPLVLTYEYCYRYKHMASDILRKLLKRLALFTTKLIHCQGRYHSAFPGSIKITDPLVRDVKKPSYYMVLRWSHGSSCGNSRIK